MITKEFEHATEILRAAADLQQEVAEHPLLQERLGLIAEYCLGIAEEQPALTAADHLFLQVAAIVAEEGAPEDDDTTE